MAHGGYGKRRMKPVARRSKTSAVEKKPKAVSLKNQIRSIERMLRKDLPSEVKEAQETKLEGLKKQQELHSRLAVERKIFLGDRKIKFFERRKIERRIRQLEKLQRTSSGQAQDATIFEQLPKLKEDLEYVRFFPKNEKYVSLFTGVDDSEILDKRNRLREQIKANLVAAAASGKELEETGSEDDGLLDLSDDDFFHTGSSSDDANADDEWTDRSTREQASSTSGKAASGMSSDERNQLSAKALMPPPRPTTCHRGLVNAKSKFGPSSSKKFPKQRAEISTSSNTSNSFSYSSFKSRGSSNSKTAPGSNLSSNSDAHKPRRKRRPKKRKTQVLPHVEVVR